MARIRTVEIAGFGGGCNDQLRPNEIAANESPTTLRNVRIDGFGKKARPGFTTIANNFTSGAKTIRGFTGFDRDAEANDVLVVMYNQALKTLNPDTSSTWSADIATTASVDAKTRFAKYKDWLFCFNGTDVPGRFDGTNYSTPFTKPDSIALAGSFTPAFGEVILNSLYVSGVSGAPNTVYISKPATSATPANIYDFSGAINAGGADEVLSPSRVTAIKKISDFGVIFTINEAAVINGFKDLGASIVPDLRPVPGSDGTYNQDTAVLVENDIYYITPKKEITALKRGFAESLTVQMKAISNKINRFLKANMDDTQTDAWGYYDRTQNLVKFFVRSVGSTFPDMCIVGDFRNFDRDPDTGEVIPRWLIDSGKAYSAGLYWKGKSYCSSAIVGQIYQDEVGLADDDDGAINTIWSTKQYDANNPTTLKRYKQVVINGEITTTTVLTVRGYVDGIQVFERTIDSSDITGDSDAGIGIDEVGGFGIGDDEILSPEENLQEFTKRIDFRATGKQIRLEFETFDINQNYIISYMDYSFIAMGKLYYPVSEASN